MPVSTPSSLVSVVPRAFLFAFRLVFFVPFAAAFFLLLDHLPLPTAARKLALWSLLGIAGLWWQDLQLDGVKRGSLSQQPRGRVPHAGSVIAANFTSPVDPLYLAAIFDPIFVVSYPGSRKVQHIGLLGAVLRALSSKQFAAPPETGLTDLRALLAKYPDRSIAVFPECGTTNGKGVLPLSPSLLSVPKTATIFPISTRYNPPDITTPVPGTYGMFLWKLLSRPNHSLRVRIAEGTHNSANGDLDNGSSSSDEDDVTKEEQLMLDRIAETLARLGRNKRVGLTLQDKAAFTKAWKGIK
jgi:1-acylglycerol-3-phosphate O-acyltransferase